MLNFQEAEDYFGASRMGQYLEFANGDRAKAVDLYLWNIRLAASYWPDIECIEILIRNRIARELFPSGWVTKNVLSEITTGKYTLKSEVERISDQNFGFWTYLLSSENQNTIWNASVHKQFAFGVARRILFSDLKYVQTLRNKIGHHGTLVEQDIDHTQVVINRVFKAISNNAGHWLYEHTKSRDALVRERPTAQNSLPASW